MSNPNVEIDRDKYIGGSDLPTILGLNAKYGTDIFEYAKEKLGIIPRKFKGNEFTRYGQLMEPIIREYINSVYQTNYHEDTIIDKVRKERGNTDGIDRDADIPILEIKTFGKELDVDYYTPQCQFYMEKFDQDACLLVGYKRPEDFYTGLDYDLEPDDEYFNIEFDEKRIETHIIYRDKKKWEEIETHIASFQNACVLLKANNDMTKEEFYDEFYGRDLMTKCNEVTILEEQLLAFKEIEENYKKAKDELYKLFDAKGIVSMENDNIKITKVNPTSYEQTSIDKKRLKEEKPKIYENYKKTKIVNKKGYVLITKKEEKENEI